MAVVQISRIQIRRGRAKTGTGFPQLASGELGWALDTQELYIGNGAVAEGSPAVGNTKILTQNDLTAQGNLLNLLEHVYKANDPSIITGPSANIPITRVVQDRLDDRVTVTDFGAAGDDSTDDSVPLQRAIDQLFLNPVTKASANTIDGVRSRVVLEIPAGTYFITNTLYIPSFTTLQGAGSDKTIIRYSGNGPAIRFVNDSSSIGSPSSLSSTLGNTQPKNISITGLSVICDSDDQVCFQLDAVRDSLFEDLKLESNWAGISNTSSQGLSFDVVSDIVTCENNVFRNLTINSFSTGIYAKKDIRNNIFENIRIDNATYGVSFGDGANKSTIGQKYGPRDNIIQDATFTNIKIQAVYIPVGKNNTISDCKLEYVGNDGGDHSTIEFPQIYLGERSNITKNIRSDRTTVLGLSEYKYRKVTLTLSAGVTASSGAYVTQAVTGAYGYVSQDVVNATTITLYGIQTNNVEISPGVFEDVSDFDTTNNLTIAGDSTPSSTNTAVYPTTIVSVDVTPYIRYIPEVSGYGSFESFESLSFLLGTSNGVFSTSFRLPLASQPNGTPWQTAFYTINYEYRSNSSTITRLGTLKVVANADDNLLHLTDDYEYIGNPAYETSLQFRARFLDVNGDVWTGGNVYALEIQHTYNLSDTGTFTYNYISVF